MEEWKLHTEIEIRELSELEKQRESLTQHLYFLDLQQIVFLRQTQRLKLKVAQLEQENRKAISMKTLTSTILTSSEFQTPIYTKQIEELIERLEKSRSLLINYKQNIIFAQKDLNLLKALKLPENTQKPDSISPEELAMMITKAKQLQDKLHTLCSKQEIAFRELKNLSVIEESLQNQLSILQPKIIQLAKQGMWGPPIQIHSSSNPLSYFHDCITL